MPEDVQGLQAAANLLEQAKGAYEKSSENLKAAMQASLDVQDSWQRATDAFYSLDSHPVLGAPVWCYLLPDGRRQGPMSLAQLYPMAHNPASGVQMDMRVWHTAAYRSVSLRDAAEHPLMQQRFQAMLAAHAAVAAAATAVREAQVTRQKSIFGLLQSQATMACLEAGSELWAECSPSQRRFSVREVHRLLVEGRAAGKRSFRRPANGHVQQTADMIVLEYEALAALKYLCTSLAEGAEEDSLSVDPQALPQLKNIRCWQRSGGSTAKVRYSSESIMELYRADKWPALQRVSHCSDPEDSWSLAAIPVACERLSTQIAELSRGPVVFPRSKVRAVAGIVEERLASHVKQELRDVVAPAIAAAVRQALQRSAAEGRRLTQEAPPAASWHPELNGVTRSLQRSGFGDTVHAADVPASFTHLNGHSRAESVTGRQDASAAEQGMNGLALAHINGYSGAEAHPGDDSGGAIGSPEASAAEEGTPESTHLSGGSHPGQSRSSARRNRPVLSHAASLAANTQRAAQGEACISLGRVGLRSRGTPPEEELHGSSPGSPEGGLPPALPLDCVEAWRRGAPAAGQLSDSESGLLHERSGEQGQLHGRRHRGRQKSESALETHISRGRSGDGLQDKQAGTAPEHPGNCKCAAGEALQPVPEQAFFAELPSAAQLPGNDAHAAASLQDRSIESLLNGIVLRADDELLALTAAALSPCQAPKASAVSGTSCSRVAGRKAAPLTAEHARIGAVPVSCNASRQRQASPAVRAGDGGADVADAKPDQAQRADASEALALAPLEPAAGQALTQQDGLDLNAVPEEPQLLAILPSGQYVFVTGVTHSEFLKQREEICTMLRCNKETASSVAASRGPQHEPELDQDPSRVILINGRTGAMSHPAPGTFEIVWNSSAQHQHSRNRQAGEGASAVELLGPEKALNKRAVKELQELFDSIQETPESRQRRQPVLLSTEQQERPDQAPRSRTPAKKRPKQDAAKPKLDGCSAAPARHSLKGAAAQQEVISKALFASKAGKADRKRREREEACKREPFICSRMLPFSKVSRRATAATKKAKRAVQVVEDPSGVNRGVKRRAERNEEILNWRKLKGKEADLKLTKSKVHAWGLVAVKPIEAQQFVIEYTGELIRLSVNAIREKLDSDSDYRFRVDDEWVVDATTKGGLARFINHCCDPNCYTKIVNVDSAKHILIFSKRAIAAGEELSYDYKFETTPGEAPIACTCGAKSCRGRLN